MTPSWGLECWWSDGDFVAFRDPFSGDVVEISRHDLKSENRFTDLSWMARRANQHYWRKKREEKAGLAQELLDLLGQTEH